MNNRNSAMNSFKLTIFVLWFAASYSFGQRAAMVPKRTASEVRSGQNAKTIEEFWPHFQGAIEKRDLEKLSQLTRFPLGGDISSIVEKCDAIHPEGFRKNFDTFFPKVAIQSILSKSPKALEFSTSHGEETWRFEYLDKGPISERDWAIIYTFRRLKNGSIRLTSIDFAG